MADVTELRCWPSCVDALDWSQDNIIALASDERVELLFPNTVSYERDNDVPQWQHVPLQVPWFSNDELPLKNPAPLSNFSIGEEISPSVPIAISWSPPGLAKHRRCALAVLTSNLVLSIWSAEGKLNEESSWNRRLLINNALTEYFSKNTTAQTSSISVSAEEQLRLRSRVRAMAWAPSLPSGCNTMGTQVSYERQYLAVSNDDNQVVFMVVDSPTSTLGSSRTWKAEVLADASLIPDQATTFTDPELFEDMVQQQRFIPHVAWSPWIRQDDQYRSVVIYATNEDVRARPVICSDGNISLSDEVAYPGMNLRYSGPLSWCPQPDCSDQLTLALFTHSGLVYATISAKDASIVNTISHDLDGRWDQVSGVAWDCDTHFPPRLHFSSLLSTIQSPTAVLQKTHGALERGKAPNWKEKIENSMVLFSVKNDLKGHSKTKVWGLTASPLGDFIAACNSLHPSDSIEYGPPADRRGTIALSTLKQYSKIRESFPTRNTTAENLLFTLKKLVENTVEDADQMPAFAEEAVEKMMQAYGPVDSSGRTLGAVDVNNLESIVKELKTIAVFDENTLKDRYSTLVSYACNDTSSNELSRTLITYRLATVLQKLPPALAHTPFSKEIIAHQKRLTALIDSLLFPNEAEDETIDGTVEVPIDQTGTATSNETNASAMDIGISSSNSARTPDAATDLCDFCSAPIPFTDLTMAACTNGHEFPRCGISLLAIQAPGITKYCGICSTPFLSEEFAQAQEAGELEAESPVSLSSVMFQACDVCVYCGGKFIG
ncbi:uncharacterized protein M421DRAFT_417498 [Didymella exigua CBS 183.55]|uniref:Transcription factor IIIC putative zinc-finger domain-containing protein n=1 Tax=Didymella exigua CBS 183.55 TaxID=1150837 RepID=A0A6A5RXI8_9PLEO|nr:uncharacterized protein M421DRAFT_417498 [Didymella exigua CBS 183.55]KAF1931738.1 hypothetical protein M421DRAFT_417498 [Didymella exigua CBS 183.55]